MPDSEKLTGWTWGFEMENELDYGTGEIEDFESLQNVQDCEKLLNERDFLNVEMQDLQNGERQSHGIVLGSVSEEGKVNEDWEIVLVLSVDWQMGSDLDSAQDLRYHWIHSLLLTQTLQHVIYTFYLKNLQLNWQLKNYN